MKVRIERAHDVVICSSVFEEVFVGGRAQVTLARMHDVPSLRAQ